jgi:hypothetical protein
MQPVNRHMRWAGLVIVATATLLASAGCGDPLPMSQDELQDYVEQELENTQDFGAIDAVSCEGGLDANVGAKTMCNLTMTDDAEQPVTVVAKKDDGGDLVPSIIYAIMSVPPAVT